MDPSVFASFTIPQAIAEIRVGVDIVDSLDAFSDQFEHLSGLVCPLSFSQHSFVIAKLFPVQPNVQTFGEQN